MSGQRFWKGAVGEHEVIDVLQPWWRKIEPRAVFARTPKSGAWASRREGTFKARGDVMCDDETCDRFRFPFTVEVKFRKEVTPKAIAHFVDGHDSPIWGYWWQCVDASIEDRLEPMLWFRGNRMTWRVVIRDGEKLRMFEGERFSSLDPMRFVPRA